MRRKSPSYAPPPSFTSWRSCGTSVVRLESSRLELTAEGLDKLRSIQLKELLGQAEGEEGGPLAHGTPFHAHSIYHGPKLKMFDRGTGDSF
jgi:hypothetical protein